VGWEAFPPFGIKPNIKAKQFSIPFKRKRVARQIQKIEGKLFCFARRVSAGGNAGAGFQIIRAIFARKRFELRSAIATKISKGISPRKFLLGCWVTLKPELETGLPPLQFPAARPSFAKAKEGKPKLLAGLPAVAFVKAKA